MKPSEPNIFITGLLAGFLFLLMVMVSGCGAPATDTPGRLSGASQEVAAVNSKVAAAAQNIFHFAQQNPPSNAQIIREHQIILAAVGQPTPKDAKDGVSRRHAGPDDKVYEVAIADAYERGKAAGLAVSESERRSAREEANRAAKQARLDQISFFCNILSAAFIVGAAVCGVLAYLTKERGFVLGLLGSLGFSVISGVVPRILESWVAIACLLVPLALGMAWTFWRCLKSEIVPKVGIEPA